MKNKLKISVLIVTYNRKEELKRAIESVYNQSYRNFDIIVYDNNSTDMTGEMLSQNFQEIKYVKSEENLGCPQGRNKLISISNGDILFFLDDDATIEQNVFEVIINKFEELGDDVKIIMPNMFEYVGNCKYEVFSVKNNIETEIYTFSGGISAIKSEVFDEVGLYPETTYGAEENFIAAKMYKQSMKIIFLPYIYAHHYPSNIRDKSAIFMNSVKNDIFWTIHFSPSILLIPMLCWKIYVWFKMSIKTKNLSAYLKGVSNGIALLPDYSCKNKIFNSFEFVKYLKKRRNSISWNHMDKFKNE